MNPAPAAPARRLVPLGAGVLAAHLGLLQAPLPAPPPATTSRFATRTIAAAAASADAEARDPPAAALAPVAPRAEAAPPPARPPRPRARPQPPLEVQAPAAIEIQPAAPQAELGGGGVPASEPPAVPPAAGPAEPPPPTTLPAAVRLPAPARYRYELTATTRGFVLHGEGALSWRHDGQAYELQLEARSPLLGARRQRSTGRVGAEGLVPEHFHDRARSEQATHFDRAAGRVTFSNNRPDAAWTEGMQDRLSVVMQLAAIVGGQPQRFGPGSRIVAPTASTREAEAWIFTVEEEGEMRLPGGTVHALKLQRLPRRQYDVKVELWLAPGLDYAPVRLRLTNPNGDTVDQRWSSTDKG